MGVLAGPGALTGSQYLANIRAVLAAGSADLINAPVGKARRTPLMTAALQWDKVTMSKSAEDNEIIEIATDLLRRGADPQVIDSEGRTVHHIAAASHNYRLLRMLLTEYPPAMVPIDTESVAPGVSKMRVLRPNQYGQTLLHLVAGHFADAVRLTKGAMDGIDVSMFHQGWENDCLSRLKNVTAQAQGSRGVYFHHIGDKENSIYSNPVEWPDPLDGNGEMKTAQHAKHCRF
eukprot:SAG31_NODE_3696_length_3980_cov_1.437001_3_plen_232_part_00